MLILKNVDANPSGQRGTRSLHSNWQML